MDAVNNKDIRLPAPHIDEAAAVSVASTRKIDANVINEMRILVRRNKEIEENIMKENESVFRSAGFQGA